MSIKNKQKIKKVIKKKINKKNIINKRPSTKGGSSTEKMKNKLKDLVDEQKLIEKKLIEQKNKKSSDKSSIKKLKDRLDELINELKLLRKEVHNPENYQTVGVVKQIEDDGKPHRHRRSYSVERTPSNRRPSPSGGSSAEKLNNKLNNKFSKITKELKSLKKEVAEKQKNIKNTDDSSIKKLMDRAKEVNKELNIVRKEIYNPENKETIGEGVLKKIEDDGKPHRHRRSYSVERTPSNRRPSPPKRGGNIDNLHKIDSTYEPTEECTKLLKQYEIDPIERTAEGIYNLTIGGRKKYKRKNKKGGNYIDQYLNRLN